jgi:hypothetical protein
MGHHFKNGSRRSASFDQAVAGRASGFNYKFLVQVIRLSTIPGLIGNFQQIARRFALQ